MQPGARVALPERGSSLPPLHVHASEPLHDVSPPSRLPDVVMEPRTSRAFPWTRLPQHIQLRILSHIILPDGPGTPLIIGDPDHSTHLRKIAVPVLLALGSWSGYYNGVRVLYCAVHMDICSHRRSSMNFLTSHRTVGPRSMVAKLRIIIDIKKSLPLFDTGYTIRQSKGKLIKMNVPTALRCMKVHGRLSEVELLIDSLAATAEPKHEVPESYLPMAEIQLANRSVFQKWDNYVASSSLETHSEIKQADIVVAPAFLACRAWQSGLLPLFEDGTFRKGASLGLVLNEYRSDQKRTAGQHAEAKISPIDGSSLMRYWIGGTIVELLDETLQLSSWTDPFTLSQRAYDLDGTASSGTNHLSEPLLPENLVADSIEDESDMTVSPANASDTLFRSAWKEREAKYEGPHCVMNLQKRREDARLGYRASHDSPGPSKGYNVHSDDESLSEDVEMRTLHQRFGVGSRVCESMSSVSPSSSESPPSSEMIGGIASPSSNPDVEARWMISRSGSLGDDHQADSSVACLPKDSSGSGQRGQEAPKRRC